MKNFPLRLGIVCAVVIIAIVFICPTIHMVINKKQQPELWPNKKINLGLDLQGGMHLLLEVQTDKALEGTMDQLSHDIRSTLRKEKIKFLDIKLVEGVIISVKIKDQDNYNKFNELLKSDFADLEATEKDNFSVVLRLPAKQAAHNKKMATDQALETIRNRIDQFGVSEPDIRIQGENRILIQLPGIKDTKRAKELIGKTALLEFKLVDDENDINAALEGKVPPGTEILYEHRIDPNSGKSVKIPLLLKKRASLTGASLTDARVQINSQYNEPYVGIEFDKKGAKIFEDVTGKNIKKRLAIVLDNKIYSAPVIQDKIGGGNAQITGSFSTEEARDLAIVLRAGALPAPVEILEERTVGPSLGMDSIKKGLMSMGVGGIFVILFMLIYYKGSGLIADFALVMNILLIAAGLAAFQATLTLPGIAGIILTIGMAVDANVLIYERIREELFLGKTPRAAVTAGFDKATLTIMDANVTTLIAALVLFQFGTGAIKGFAVTLSLGILSSLFTALVISRLLFDYLTVSKKIKTLSI